MFNPGNPRYRRGVFLFSIYAGTITGFIVSLADFGTQEHILSGYQNFVHRTIDNYFDITSDELNQVVVAKRLRKS